MYEVLHGNEARNLQNRADATEAVVVRQHDVAAVVVPPVKSVEVVVVLRDVVEVEVILVANEEVQEAPSQNRVDDQCLLNAGVDLLNDEADHHDVVDDHALNLLKLHLIESHKVQ